MKKKLIIVYLVLILCLIYGVSYTQTITQKVRVLPPRQELWLRPGGEKEGNYTVMNISGERLLVRVVPRSWYVLEENKEIPLESWLEVSPKEFYLQGGETGQVKFKVSAPPDAVGILSAMIAVHSEGRTEHSMINPVISSSLYAFLENTTEFEAELKKVNVFDYRSMKNLRVAYTIENKGNVHIRPHLRLEIYKEDKIVEISTQENGSPVYPRMEDAVFGDWKYNEKLEPGEYKLSAVIDYGHPAGEKIYDTTYFKVDEGGEVTVLE